jgi:RNA polymerase sigma-70 factor (ECF subfamily)
MFRRGITPLQLSHFFLPIEISPVAGAGPAHVTDRSGRRRAILGPRLRSSTVSHPATIIDAYAQSKIRRKAKQLIGRCGFTRQDSDDLEQELTLRLLQSLPSFNPAHGHWNVYVTTVIERAADKICRAKRAEKRNHCRVRSLDALLDTAGDDFAESSCPDPSGPSALQVTDDIERLDLANDITHLLPRMPQDLRDLCERLMRQSISQAARDMGVPRTSLYRTLSRLRRWLRSVGCDPRV